MIEVAASLPDEWEVIVWNNKDGVFRWGPDGSFLMHPGRGDLSVYGRYAAIEYASHDLIYVQDDDVIVSDPQAIVDEWLTGDYMFTTREEFFVANMPQEFRHDGYTDSCLVGFGACFHRDLPKRAFDRWFDHWHYNAMGDRPENAYMQRTCDVVFTTLTPRVLVDVPKTDREMASAPNRMWKQPSHFPERARMLELARQVRDA
jgi:hypothetical protein